MKSCLKPVVDFETNSKSFKNYKWFRTKKYQIDNQRKCINCLNSRSNKNESECKKCDCDYFYVPNY